MSEFNIRKDLQEGDIIRRIDYNNADVHFVDEEYEFLRYANTNGDLCIVTKCHPEDTNGGYANRFVFVRRPCDVAKKIVCNYITAMYILKSKIADLVFDCNGKAYHFNAKKDRAYDDGGNSAPIESISNDWHYFEEPKKKNLYPEEFIEAMTKLLNSYLDGTKTSNAYRDCELCKTLCSIKGLDVNKMHHWDTNNVTCDICPWVVKTGKVCTEQSSEDFFPLNPFKRSKELVDWIESYKKMDQQ